MRIAPELRAAVDAGVLGPIDAAFGDFVLRHAGPTAGDDAPWLARTAALASRERERGHACVFLGEWAGRSLDDASANPVLPPFPALDAWRALLARSPLVGDGTGRTPLVVEGDRLYLARFHHAELRVAAGIRARVAATTGDVGIDRAAFVARFPSVATAGVDWQALAAVAALSSRFAVVLGGPGTGKTFTVARLLAALLTATPTARVALCAPTGKAAARLAESIDAARAKLDAADAARLAALPKPTTLHRALGYRPDRERFRHGPGAPLPADVVVLDEASMVDLELMAHLFDALAPDARLILLGDPDQLASVATGHVLGDLMDAADGAEAVGAELATRYAALGGTPPAATETHPLANRIVRLRASRRFDPTSGLGRLADAVRRGDAEAAVAVLDDPARADALRTEPFTASDTARQLAFLDDWLARVTRAADPAAALAALGEHQILCALRNGPQGATGVIAAIEAHLARRGLPHPGEHPFHDGRPILITANDPAARLFNGDLGVAFRDADGRPAVWFPSADPATPRRITPALLPPHATAWATTIHKSQGSEYDAVLLVLPERDSPVLSRELVFTGITRARARVRIAATVPILERAIGARTRRSSGLVERLRDVPRGTERPLP